MTGNNRSKEQHCRLGAARPSGDNPDRNHEDLFGKPVPDNPNNGGKTDGKEECARLEPGKQVGEVLDHDEDYTRTIVVDRIDPITTHNQQAVVESIRSTTMVWMCKHIP